MEHNWQSMFLPDRIKAADDPDRRDGGGDGSGGGPVPARRESAIARQAREALEAQEREEEANRIAAERRARDRRGPVPEVEDFLRRYKR